MSDWIKVPIRPEALAEFVELGYGVIAMEYVSPEFKIILFVGIPLIIVPPFPNSLKLTVVLSWVARTEIKLV